MPILKSLALQCFIISLISCQSQDQTVQKTTPNWGFNPQFESKIDSLVSILTLEEKVNLAHGSGKFFSGGVERLGISEVQYADGPLGVREEIERDTWSPIGWTNDSASYFPCGGGLAATWNPALSRIYGECIGAEARARGKDYLLAPAINIQRTPLNGRNYEYFSEDPYLISTMAVPYVRGVQDQDVAACVKHFAVNNQETNREFVDAQMNERALREIYLPAFKATVQEGQAYSIMGAYNKFRGKYLCENQYMLNDILKGEWGFQGTVVSDWAATHSTIASANSGLDVEMGSAGDYQDWFMADALKDAVKSGDVSEKVIDEIARRNLRVLINLKKTDSNRKKGAINIEKHRKLMYEVASESIVLLKNSNNVLPLDVQTIKSIAVIGDNAKQKHASGGFGAGVKVQYEVSPFEGLQNRLPNMALNYAQGYKKQFIPDGNKREFLLQPDNTPNQKMIDEAVAAAQKSDVAIIFAGSNRISESESMDRADMDLPYGQIELIEAVAAANPKTVVVLACGTPFDLRRVNDASSAIIWAWFNGSEGGNALADVIIGTVNPSGKLPFTIPYKLEDSPAHATNSFPGTKESVTYDEGLLVGYRWFDTKKVPALFAFGHGESYTSYEYGVVSTDKPEYKNGETISVSVEVKNSGDIEGLETVQIYMEDVESSLMRPLKELKGFSKVSLDAGQTDKVQIDIPVSSLAFFDDKKMKWVVEPGEFKIHIGTSSADVKKTLSVEVI
ncbi:MAG: glycoside hydrolase family 3 C-terminal domain-containing protein [Reichenbachiella sp.]